MFVYNPQELLGIQSMPTIPENKFDLDVNEHKKPKSKRKSTSPKKVIIEYNKINLTIESLKPKFLNTIIFSLSGIRQAKTRQ